MFSTFAGSVSDYSDRVVDAFVRVQARPADMTVAFPGHKMHVRSINNAMRAIHIDLAYVKDALSRWEGEEWVMVADSVSTKLSRATVMLQGQLDAMAMCANDRPGANVTFNKTVFEDDEMAQIQVRLKRLESRAIVGQSVWADFSTVANFWKHYIPYQPLPVAFESGVVDFQAVIGKDEIGNEIKTGPLLQDLIFPTYAGARLLLERLAQLYGVGEMLQPPAL
jgi:hypothetical protein